MKTDLSKVDEVGLASLAPGGGHGIAGSFKPVNGRVVREGNAALGDFHGLS